MGWKDLFKARTVKAKADPRVRWFGKLPTYADYYTSLADEDWAVEFNDWVLKGCEVYLGRQRERGGDPGFPSSAGVIRLPKSQFTVLCSIQDYGGDMRGRRFPLCFYVGVPTEQWPGPTSDTVLPALRAMQQLTRLREDVVRFLNSPGRFESAFGDREVDVSELDGSVCHDGWRPAARALVLDDWLTAARPALKAAEPGALRFIVNDWGKNIEQLASPSFSPVLRFPLVMSLPFETQVPGWLYWLGGRLDLTERALSLLMAEDANGLTGRLTVVARDVLPEDFLLFTSLADTLPYADDLCQVPPPEEPEGVSGAMPATWLEFVESRA